MRICPRRSAPGAGPRQREPGPRAGATSTACPEILAQTTGSEEYPSSLLLKNGGEHGSEPRRIRVCDVAGVAADRHVAHDRGARVGAEERQGVDELEARRLHRGPHGRMALGEDLECV